MALPAAALCFLTEGNKTQLISKLVVSLCGVGREGHVNPPVGLKEKSTQQTDAEMHVGSLGCEGASMHMAACRESALNTLHIHSEVTPL